MTQILVSVLVASLLGSLHCAGMCGGFVAFYSGAERRAQGLMGAHLAYNFGRLATYMVVGAVAGGLGSVADVAGVALGLGRIAAILAGSMMLAWGGVLLLAAFGVKFPRSKFIGWLPQRLTRRVSRLAAYAAEKPPTYRAAVLGLSSALLPCGWLYAFAVVAVGAGSPFWGAVVMAAFWVGTVPMMLGVGLGIQTLSQRFRAKIPIISALLLIVVGAVSILGRLSLDQVVRDSAYSLDLKAKAGVVSASPQSAPCCDTGR